MPCGEKLAIKRKTVRNINKQPHKQPKMNRYQPSKPMLTNSFEELKEELDDININVRIKKQSNLHPFLLLVSIIFRFSHND